MRLMTGKRAETLLELMRPIEHFTLGRAWTNLTDDEFFWEPFATTWSIRRQEECSTPNPFGTGEWVADFAIPEPDLVQVRATRRDRYRPRNRRPAAGERHDHPDERRWRGARP
jgi:hypothetical protein